MTKSFHVIALALAFGLGNAQAASHAGAKMDAASAPTAQQSKMKTCNAEAKDRKGDDRKAFMSECLKKDKPVTQQDKMKSCNAEAKGKKGDDRKAFMSECLKKDKAA